MAVLQRILKTIPESKEEFLAVHDTYLRVSYVEKGRLLPCRSQVGVDVPEPLAPESEPSGRHAVAAVF